MTTVMVLHNTSLYFAARTLIMLTTPGKYIDATSDFGFKKLFECEPNKPLLIAFLNEIFIGKHKITDLVFPQE